MHRVPGVAAILIFVVLGAGPARAQTVQETYTALCGDGRQSETCDALAKVLEAQQAAAPAVKAAAPAPAPASPPDPVWGPLAALAGTRWVAASDARSTVDTFEWIENGSAIRFTTAWLGADPDMVIVFRPARRPGVLRATVTSPDDGNRKVDFHFEGNDGVLLSEWFHRFTVMGMAGTSERLELRWSATDGYESRHAISAQRDDRPDFAPLNGSFRQYSDAELAPILARSLLAIKSFNDEVAAGTAELMRAEERAREQRVNEPSLFGAMVRGIAMGVSGIDAPLMNADGSEPNTLDVLYAANAELSRQNAEGQARLDASIADAQRQAEWQRRADRERDEAEQAATSAAAIARQSEAQATADARAEADADAQAEAEAERKRQEAQQRMAEQQRKEEQAEAEKAQKQAEALAAREKAAAEEQQRREQQTRQAESELRTSFLGRATTCAGGGSGILYLQTSRPPRTGCDVQFEARCPGTQPGNGVRFGQNNYIGGSCMGIGDAIEIGQMSCPADQVQIQMIAAACG